MTRHQWYFVKQKLIGLVAIVFTLLVGIFTGVGSLLVFSIPIGGYLIVTKKMIIQDKYFYELEEKKLKKYEKEL